MGSCALPSTVSAYVYAAAFLATVVVSWVLRDYAAGALQFSPVDDCLPAANATDPSAPVDTSCLGTSAVLRLSCGTLLFFSALFVLTLCVTTEDDPRLEWVHNGLWPPKLAAWAALAGAAFLFPNAAIEGYGQAARAFAALFILVQLVILLESVYGLNEWLLDAEWGWALVGLTAALVAGGVAGAAVLFAEYGGAGCHFNNALVAATLVLFALYGGLSVSPWRAPSAGLLTSAAVFAYTVYYTWSALASLPADAACAGGGGGGGAAVRVTGFALAVAAVGVTAVRTAAASAAFGLGGGGDDAGGGGLPYRPDFFHAVFVLAAAYMAMVLTGWELLGAPGADQGDFTADTGWGSTWTKAAAAWTCAALYAWSLVAHRVCACRDFG